MYEVRARSFSNMYTLLFLVADKNTVGLIVSKMGPALLLTLLDLCENDAKMIGFFQEMLRCGRWSSLSLMI